MLRRIGNLIGARNLKVKMLAAFVPVVILTLMTTGYLTYRVSNNFIKIASDKAARIHVASLAHEMEQFLEKCRKDLALIAQEAPNQANMSRYLANMRKIGGIDYRILAFVSQGKEDPIVHVAFDDYVQSIDVEMQERAEPNLQTFYKDISGIKKGETWVSGVKKIEYPFPLSENQNHVVSSNAIFFGTRYLAPDGTPAGYFLLALDIHHLKKILSSYHIDQSKLWTSEENGEERYSYFFDPSGWILFDSGDPKERRPEISTDLARSGYEGMLGSPELAAAYKPDEAFWNFWNMIAQVKAGKYGSTKTANLEIQSPGPKEHLCAYAPVLFWGGEGVPDVYGGVAFVDRSRLTEAAISEQVDVVFIITLVAIVIVSLVIFFFAHFITKPLLALTHGVDSMQRRGKLEPIEISPSGYEITLLKNSINMMISKIIEQIEQIKFSEKQREIATLRGTAGIEEQDAYSKPSLSQIEGLIGNSPSIETLRSEILKAAKVDMDVLIVGETGTGKQLVAEAIQRYSRRSVNPMVSINCGELDEHLLLDTLFGHIRGAFTEAKADRKGAFLESDGGVIFLDEIQAASSAVQQALLRVISQRRIKHLGSDKDTQVDVRVIAATNAELKDLVDQGKFRQDLYFRLKVITIHTPSLREISEDIPLLARHYFAEAKRLTRNKKLSMSKGALEKLKSYGWPGNVRELMNCITRAVVMSESSTIQAEDLILESDDKWTAEHGAVSVPGAKTGQTKEELETEDNLPVAGQTFQLTSRQQKVYRYLIEKGSITRLEYQALVGGNLASRTAVYDLHDLVRKGVLNKEGKGPATRYLLRRPVVSHLFHKTNVN
jgi:DNA-binding NtrC family response regulator